MTNAELLAKIKAEIERLEKIGGIVPLDNREQKTGYESALLDIGTFLDTLEEPVCEELEEAAMNYIAPIENEDGLRIINFSGQDIKDAFIAGAKWQYQKDRAEFAKIKAKTWCEGFDACKEQMMKDGTVILTEEDFDAEKEKSMEWGYNLCKEQMMKEAVEGEVMTNGFYPYEPRIVAPYPNCPYDFGDKVRVIVIKEDEK